MHVSTSLWAIFLAPVSAYALPPRQTLSSSSSSSPSSVSISAHPQPTQPPAPALVQKRFNTVCGFISGNPLLPATCDSGSHCAVDTGAGILGCCPDVGACTTGLFTGCVDSNSGTKTDASKDPYIFTCSTGSVCYENSFQGGFKQFGCGTASNVAATVMMSMTGVTALDIEKVTVLANIQAAPNRVAASVVSPEPLTAVPKTSASSATTTPAAASSSSSTANAASSSSSTAAAAASPSSVSTSATSKGEGSVSASSVDPSPAVGQVSGVSASATAAADSSSSSSGANSASPAGSSSSSPSSSTATGAAASSSQSSGKSKSDDDVPTGAVVGGTLAGVAAVVIAASVGFWYVRRKQKRSGELSDGKKPLVSPMSDRKNFVPLASPLPTDGRGAYMRTPEPEPAIIASQQSPLPPPASPRRAPQNTMSYASSTYSRYLQPGALPSPTSPYNENGQALARDVNEYTNSYMQAIREETESNYSRQSDGIPPVPPMPKRPGSNWL